MYSYVLHIQVGRTVLSRVRFWRSASSYMSVVTCFKGLSCDCNECQCYLRLSMFVSWNAVHPVVGHSVIRRFLPSFAMKTCQTTVRRRSRSLELVVRTKCLFRNSICLTVGQSWSFKSMVMQGESEPATKQGQLATDIPDIVRAWDTSVRRPTTLPEPGSYHEATDPTSIFELDILDDEGNKKSIFVVPPRCQYCVSIAQACSRALPTCLRCTRGGRTCTRVRDGYNVLPRPKLSKGRKNKRPESEVEGSALHVALGEDGAEDGYVPLVYFSIIAPLIIFSGCKGDIFQRREAVHATVKEIHPHKTIRQPPRDYTSEEAAEKGCNRFIWGRTTSTAT